VLVKEAKMLGAQLEHHLLLGARLEVDPAHALQFHDGTSDRSQHVARVELHHFVAGARTAVAHAAAHGRAA
jgi:hypothetical protein